MASLLLRVLAVSGQYSFFHFQYFIFNYLCRHNSVSTTDHICHIDVKFSYSVSSSGCGHINMKMLENYIN